MQNKMEDLRNHLFAQLERLGDEDKPPNADELARARAVSDIAKTLIDSARVEVDFRKVQASFCKTAPQSDFIDAHQPAAKALSNGSGTRQ